MKADVKLLVVNVLLSAIAAFTGALAVTTDWDKAALAAAGYAALRAAIGLGSVYASRLQAQVQAQVDDKGFGQ